MSEPLQRRLLHIRHTRPLAAAAVQMDVPPATGDLPAPVPNPGTADFEAALALKTPLLRVAAQRMLSGDAFGALRANMSAFREANPWVEDSALFARLRNEPEHEDVPWWNWEAAVRDREAGTISALREKYLADIDEFVAIQAIFDRQWQAVKVRGVLCALAAVVLRLLLLRLLRGFAHMHAIAPSAGDAGLRFAYLAPTCQLAGGGGQGRACSVWLPLCPLWLCSRMLLRSRSSAAVWLRDGCAVQEYANANGVDLIGDMPIYVGGQSADVWANPELFELGADGAPEQVSGVPPDAFSETGQLWGSPLYRWDAHAAEDYAWWAQRIGRAGQVRQRMSCVLALRGGTPAAVACSLRG